MTSHEFDIEKTAKLAMLNLTPEQKKRFGKQLREVLSYMEQLNQLDTGAVEPLRHVLEMATPFREDTVAPSMDRQKTLMNAPAQAGGYFKTPKVMD